MTSRCSTWLGALLCGACWLLSLAAPARAEAALALPPASELARLQASLERGSFTEVIDQLELWSDQGMVHPDLSFNRGLAYLGRSESPARREGDLGQAAAGFEEALLLSPDDEEARTAVTRIRERITQSRARQEGAQAVRPRLSRALLGLVGENIWAGLTVLGSLLASVALVVRFFGRSRELRLAGGIALAVAASCFVLGGVMTGMGSLLRERFEPAIVIVPKARLLDAAGRPFVSARGPASGGEASDRVPEGALVYVAEARGALRRVEWGDTEAWLDARGLRRLGKR